MAPQFAAGTITASIYQQPHRQGQIAVRVLADNLTNKIHIPGIIHLSPGVVMSSICIYSGNHAPPTST